MVDKECLGVSQRSRGVIPTRVSDLENDLEFISREDLEKIVESSTTGEYTGAVDPEGNTEVIVDNLYKTIRVKLLRKIEDSLEKLLPVENGKLKDGGFILSASVEQGKAFFGFSESSYIIPANYYYGNTSSALSDIAEADILSLSNGGSTKEDKEYTYFTYKQYQVFAYPSRFGELSEIRLGKTGLNVIDLFSRKELKVNGLDYYVYESEASVTGDFVYKFIY